MQFAYVCITSVHFLDDVGQEKVPASPGGMLLNTCFAQNDSHNGTLAIAHMFDQTRSKTIPEHGKIDAIGNSTTHCWIWPAVALLP